MIGSAVKTFIDSVYHRTPVLSPWYRTWATAAGLAAIPLILARSHDGQDRDGVLPYDGQIDVPLSFNGATKPNPPAPSTGWPSGYPITLYGQGLP